MACPHSTIRRRLRAVATPLATGLVAAMVSGCALKAPPDAAAIKEQALPALQAPAQWTVAAPGVPGVGAVIRAGSRIQRRSIDGGRHRSDRAQRRSARRRRACRAGAAPCQAGGRQALAVGRCARARRRQVVRRRFRPPRRRAHRHLGGRSLGPRALRPRGQRRASRVGGRRISTMRGNRSRPWWPRAGSWPPRLGLQADAARETIRVERGAGPARRRARAHRRRQSGRCRIRRAPPSAAIATSCASSSLDAQRSDSRARAPARPLPGGRGRHLAAVAVVSRRRAGRAPVRTARAAAGRDRRRASRGGGVQPDSARPRRLGCRSSR